MIQVLCQDITGSHHTLYLKINEDKLDTNLDKTISKENLIISYESNVKEKYFSLRSNESQKIRPIELQYDEEAHVKDRLMSFDSPEKHKKKIY